MADMRLRTKDHETGLSLDLTIDAPAEPDTEYGSHVLMAAIVYLIEAADIEKWDFSPAELGSRRFLGAILAAAAHRYHDSQGLSHEASAPYGILKGLLEDLHTSGHL